MTAIHYSTKIVSRTDMGKKAYIVTKEQKAIFDMAGVEPEVNGTGAYTEKNCYWGDIAEPVSYTYYGSVRNTVRDIEYRIGLIFKHITVDDHFTVMWDGKNLSFHVHRQYRDLLNYISTLTADAVESRGYSRGKTYNAFSRDTTVMLATKKRANYSCELKGCSWVPFKDINDNPYIEAHHIIPLANGGLDTLENCAALCPGCHRMAHYSNSITQKNIQKSLMKLRNK